MAHRILLNEVAEQDQTRLHDYSNYDLAVLTPIIFPLSFALVALCYAYYRILFVSVNAHPTARIVTGAVTTVEAIFAVFCWASCVANYSKMGYSGGLSACDFQGWYSAFYAFLQPIVLLIAAVTAMVVHSKRSFPSPLLVGAAIAAATVFAVIMSSLPMMGTSKYRFPKDFCTFDVTNDTVGALFMSIFFPGAIVLVAASIFLRSHDLWWLYPLLTALYLWGFTTLPVISIMDWTDNLEEKDNVWGWMAILMHTQQLANPLVYSMLWLPRVQELGYIAGDTSAKDEETGHTLKEDPDNTDRK